MSMNEKIAIFVLPPLPGGGWKEMFALLHNANVGAHFFHYTSHAGLTGDRTVDGTFVGHLAKSANSLCSPVEDSWGYGHKTSMCVKSADTPSQEASGMMTDIYKRDHIAK